MATYLFKMVKDVAITSLVFVDESHRLGMLINSHLLVDGVQFGGSGAFDVVRAAIVVASMQG